ncbi:MAG: transporter substrate-binding domain-containing protein, partial [Deltaproteobacteria bacterium]|nr:transporter substrate-binding domain-containing protein [Deltaproteobacteria bacterium]
MLVEDLDPAAHELVVVGLVARRAAQRPDAGLLRDVDPDLGNEDPFEVEARDHPGTLAEGRAADKTRRPRTTRTRVASRAAAIVTLLVGIAACAPAAHRTVAPPSVAPPLRVGTSGDYPPFSVRAPDGTFDGFDVAAARAYARDRGRSVELVPFTWPELERRLVARELDVVMSGVTVRGDRLAIAPMSATVARASAVLVAPASRTAPVAADGAGLHVAVNRGGHLERVARARLTRATIETVDDNRSLPRLLSSGAVDAVVTDTLEIETFAEGGEDPGRVAVVLSEDRKAWWVAPGNDGLADDLDSWLAARSADGTLAALRARYLGAAAAGDGGLPAGPGRVVDLVARRLLLMPEVAAAKAVAGMPVEVPAREAEVLERARG